MKAICVGSPFLAGAQEQQHYEAIGSSSLSTSHRELWWLVNAPLHLLKRGRVAGFYLSSKAILLDWQTTRLSAGWILPPGALISSAPPLALSLDHADRYDDSRSPL